MRRRLAVLVAAGAALALVVVALAVVLVGVRARSTDGADHPGRPDRPPDGVAGPGWTLVAAGTDEFDGSGPVDPDRWDTTRATEGFAAGGAPFNPPIERAFYREDGVVRADGVALFTVRDEPATTVAGQEYRLSSGMIHTGPHRSVVRAPGQALYLEARIMLPTGAHGLWPAFWLVNAAHDEPRWRAENQVPEIDVAEVWADGASKDWRRPWSNTHTWDGSRVVHGREQAYGRDALGDWHTYGVRLDDDGVVPYFDGVPHPEAGSDVPLPAGRPMDLVLNLALARCRGHAQSCDRPAFSGGAGLWMKVDHVREYRRDG